MYGIARLLQTSRRAIPYKNHGLRRASVRLHCMIRRPPMT